MHRLLGLRCVYHFCEINNFLNLCSQNKTHMVKQANAPIIEEMVVDDDQDMPVTVVEFDYNLNFLWKGLRQCDAIPLNQVVPADEEYDASVALNARQSDL